MPDRKSNPYVKPDGERLAITNKGHQHLSGLVTDSRGPVYAFYGKASPLMAAAAMARLSRRGSDMREIYLDEFAQTGEADASGLIHRVVTAYGDDSVQQLVGLHLVVEDASNLLTKLLEWGRFAGYLEQSTRYIYFDEKDRQGRYKYYTPANLDSRLSKQYRAAFDEIFNLYSTMVRQLTDFVRAKTGLPETEREQVAWRGATRAQACDAVRAVLPVATKSTVGIFGSAQAIESLILHLFSEPLLEARITGQQILTEARKVIPAFLERTDRPDRGGAITAHRAQTRSAIQNLASQYLPTAKGPQRESVKLLQFWPTDEMELVPHMLFAQSNLSTDELKKAVSKISPKDRETIFEAYMGQRLNRRHKPGRALELAHYLWEITADYGAFRDLQRHRVVDSFEWQRLGIGYGYEVPQLVKEARLEAPFRRCFKISEKLYGVLVEAGYLDEAQYAVLFGHRLRYRFMLNARAAFHFHELRTSPQGHPGYRRIVGKMHQLLSDVHPRLGRAMIFVNKDEDPELTRLAAELATQYKLEKLELKLAPEGKRHE